MPPSSPRSAKRKIQDVATSEASASSDSSTIFKKICAEDLGKSLETDKDKENDAPMPSFEQIPQGKHPKVELTKAAALGETRGHTHNGTGADPSVVTMSVAARAALFESAISKSGGDSGRGTLPLKRPISRPPLKQSFSTLNVGRSNSTRSDSPRLNAAAKFSAHSAEELSAAVVTPPPPENRGKSFARPGTPKKPELPGLAIIKEPESETVATKTDTKESGGAANTDNAETLPDASVGLPSGGDCEDADDSVFENGSLSLSHKEADIAPEVLANEVAEMHEQGPDEGTLQNMVVPSEIDQAAQAATTANDGKSQVVENIGKPAKANTVTPLENETLPLSATPLETETLSPTLANSHVAECQQPPSHLMSTPKPASPKASTGQRTAELPRTISSFRKQQRDATPQGPSFLTPSKTSKDIVSGEEEQLLSLDDRLKALQDCILAQQTVISQATQALNLCQASAEFLGSSEQVEGEKLLLIATQKRLAYINEIQRLKVGGDNPASELPRGSVVIKKIQFPINKDSLKSSSGFVYHFLCMVQCRGKVHASQLISSDTVLSSEQSCLEFDNVIEYSNVDEDFQVQIDLYGLKTVNPVVPHDKKYHIKKETIKMKLSSRGKKTDSIFMTPGISSPGGPNAVRTSSFQCLGSFVLSTSNCHQSVFALSKVPGSFFIEGKAFVDLHLHADHGLEHRGFLTLFEEVGGFGAWTRLWCMLKGSHLVLWRYPEDEDCKHPIDSIDLRQCITKEVSRLPRTECARANTFELVVVEPLGNRHRDTLTTTRHATVAVTRHRLSADSKDDLNVWCTAFNRVLSCIRKWDPEAYKAMDVKQFV
ncbi:anillin-like isoform X5 [Dermacentor silvarum]|uniref:anillin-like isoform X5 n=1 Tax=Dermacentor silvarum TaxID=543639 RepID=UPI001899C08D|nr:anillin-like isoform X5 [Dermacentor silvarum]